MNGLSDEKLNYMATHADRKFYAIGRISHFNSVTKFEMFDLLLSLAIYLQPIVKAFHTNDFLKCDREGSSLSDERKALACEY